MEPETLRLEFGVDPALWGVSSGLREGDGLTGKGGIDGGGTYPGAGSHIEIMAVHDWS